MKLLNMNEGFEMESEATHYNRVNGLLYKVEDDGFVSVWSDWLEFWSETPHRLADYAEGEMEEINK